MNELPKMGIIYFGTQACGHGYSEDQLIKTLQSNNLPLVIPEEEKVVQWSKQLSITQIPSFVIIKDGQVKEIFSGFLSETQILAISRYYFSKKEE